MFREMRRVKQMMPEKDCIAVLERATAGVLAVAGDDDYPYAVPVSYVYEDGKIYFHTAVSGHKMDAIAKQEKVSFCVIDEDQIVPEEFTTYFRSVIAFGKAKALEGEALTEALVKLCGKYSPKESADHVKAEIADSMGRVAVVEISIEHLSGKEAIEFVKARG